MSSLLRRGRSSDMAAKEEYLIFFELTHENSGDEILKIPPYLKGYIYKDSLLLNQI